MNLQEEFASGKSEGVFHLRNGEIGFTSATANDDGTFSVRYETGWHCDYSNDGKRLAAGVIRRTDGSMEVVSGDGRRDIVKFEPMTWDEARAKYHGIGLGFSP